MVGLHTLKAAFKVWQQDSHAGGLQELPELIKPGEHIVFCENPHESRCPHDETSLVVVLHELPKDLSHLDGDLQVLAPFSKIKLSMLAHIVNYVKVERVFTVAVCFVLKNLVRALRLNRLASLLGHQDSFFNSLEEEPVCLREARADGLKGEYQLGVLITHQVLMKVESLNAALNHFI